MPGMSKLMGETPFLKSPNPIVSPMGKGDAVPRIRVANGRAPENVRPAKAGRKAMHTKVRG